MEEKINLNIRPDASIYEIFTRYNYEIPYALAEFVDNSTASFYDHEEELLNANSDSLLVDIKFDKGIETLEIYDDAYGMEIENFQRAILLGAKPSKTGGRNEFGLGLKTAATWFGRCWTVESTELGSENKYIATMDLDYIIENNLNDIDIVKVPCEKTEHGTKITISKLNRTLGGKKIKDQIVYLLQMLYKRDIITGKIKIRYNEEELTAEEYEPLFYRNKTWKKNLDFTIMYKNKNYHITGFVGILNEGSYKKTGFALYRRNRVVVPAFAFKPSSIYRQAQSKISLKLYGELDMDDFDINQQKDGFAWDTELEELFLENLKYSITDYIATASLGKDVLHANLDVCNQNNASNTNNSSTNNASNVNNQESDAPVVTVENFSDSLRDDSNSPEVTNTEYTNTVVMNQTSENNTVISVSENIDSQYKFKDLNSNNFIVCWKDIVGNSQKFFYKFNKYSGELEINTLNDFIKTVENNEREKISKMILAYCLAEEKAKSSCNTDGYVSASTIHNQFNKFLLELKKI